jgi:hypothetical protein
MQEASQIRDARLTRQQNKELLQFTYNPHPDIPRGRSLPPNAGTKRAMESWKAQSESACSSISASETMEGISNLNKSGNISEGPYQARDVFVLHSSGTRGSGLITTSSMLIGSPGGIGFESEKYEEFIKRKTASALGSWEYKKKVLPL